MGIILPIVLKYIPSLEQAMSELVWQIPLGVFSTLTIARLTLAPYWIYKKEKKHSQELEQGVLKHEWEYRRQKRIELLGNKYDPLPILMAEINTGLEYIIPNFMAVPENIQKLDKALELVGELDIESITDYNQLVTHIRRILDLEKVGFHELAKSNKQIVTKITDFTNICNINDDENLAELLNDYTEVLFKFITLSIVKEYGDDSKRSINERLKYLG